MLAFIFVIILVSVVLISHFYTNNLNHKLKRILPLLYPKDTILDVGSGDGCLTQAIGQMGYKIKAIDVVDKNSCYRPLIFDGKKIPYPDKSFDVVICVYVLHHVPNYRGLLSEMKRVSKRSILIFEDTPSCHFDRYLSYLHSDSHWGQCFDCFKNVQEWAEVYKSLRLKIHKKQIISRFEFPFAHQPYFYPVSKTLFELRSI